MKVLNNPTSFFFISFSELVFLRKVLLFLKENKNYFYDMRFNISLEDLSEDEAFDHYYNGDFAITASRAKFQHNELKNTSIKTKAMAEVKAGNVIRIF